MMKKMKRRVFIWLVGVGLAVVVCVLGSVGVGVARERTAGQGAGQEIRQEQGQHGLVDVKKVIPDIILDIRYATSNNFTKQVLYSSAECYLLEEVALALKEVQSDLKKQGYRLKVYDGYRPLPVQWKMWKVVPDPDFVADPRKGSYHNRGCAVDVGLLDIEGRDVEMPTGFDDFTEKANPKYQNLPPAVIEHRRILTESMASHGFSQSTTEWWHFVFTAAREKPVLDIPFEALKD